MTERKVPVPQNALGCAIACINFSEDRGLRKPKAAGVKSLLSIQIVIVVFLMKNG